MKSDFTAIDLFSGCGGMTAGLKAAGFRVLAAVEILPYARMTYKENHPEVRLYSDIRDLQSKQLISNLKLRAGDLDLLAGCPPCQGFSRIRTKNKRQPAEDQRNELVFDFLRLALDLKPKTLLMENVPGLLNNSRMNKSVKALKSAGYNVALDVLDAAQFKVPQRRKRMILMASRIGTASLPKGSSKIITVKNKIGSLPIAGKSGIYWHDYQRNHSEKVMKIIHRISKDGGSRSDLGEDQLECHKRIQGFRDVYGRMAWDKVAPTITRFCINPSKGRFLHPEENRAITVYEASLLQSFPRKYRFPKHLTISQVASMIGEALSPEFAKAQAKHIKELLALGSNGHNKSKY